MDETELIAALRDAIAPTDLGWWPPAPGWWALVLLVLLIVGILLWYFWPSVKRAFVPEYAGLKKSALLQLKIIAEQEALTDSQWVRQMSSVLKRVAIQRFPDKKTAGLSGVLWLEFMAKTSKGRAFQARDFEQSLPSIQAQYQASAKVDRQQLMQQAQLWVQAL